MTGLRVLGFNLFFYGYTFATAFSLYVLAKLSTRERMQGRIRRWGRTVRRALRLFLGSRVEVRGLENLPETGGRLLVSKHQSELDIVMIAELFPDASAVAMAELKRYPFFGPILDKLGVVMVAVDSGPQGRTAQVVEGARRVIAEEARPMIIYPEGELMALGARERYRRGAGHIYAALGVPAYPVAASLGAIWPQRRWAKNVGRVGAIEFLPPVAPGLALEPFMAEVQERIETATMALIREHAGAEELAAAEDRFARGLNNAGEPAAPAGAPAEGAGARS
ncbi:1-acyl-sn-glycerol-3-phosphate acyltransferase [Paralimibaculum aggregatum]|uniref:1-acyl-sn-glycerol-3-phosphate acyltransferase n=1 Tax=Paralimibaculum aggregatum TaxID=3036245 RepID=A0ABQ6LDI8_9RHOB|nr:lysophospholipid acyltransferase family protein [Limibaculum sp. NKW23]GMG81424.1 1-acyl-sn-glycerol-3-phosphate acyltransferase [Limibaculum sp. NKW23]